MKSIEDLRPKQLRILGREYKIKFKDDLGVLGLCEPEECRIKIEEGQHVTEEADTVLHEVLHAVHYLMNIGLSSKMEESVVRKTATALIQVFADNPEFLTYLANATEPNRRR